MKVTGPSLLIYRTGVQALIDQVNNQIVTCPDPAEFAADLKQLNATLKTYRKELKAINRAMTFENHVARLREARGQ